MKLTYPQHLRDAKQKDAVWNVCLNSVVLLITFLMGEKSSCVYRYTYTEYLTVYTKLYVNYVYANTDILYETRYTKYQAVYCSQPISQRSLHTDHKDL